MARVRGWQRLCGVILFCVATAVASRAQGTLTTLVNFNGGRNGRQPAGMSLIQGADGNLYGVTRSGGANHGGTVFKMTPAGKLTTLYNFCSLANCADGDGPWASLVQATNGKFYGITVDGGSTEYCGTVFEITSDGKLTTLHNFDGADGCEPFGALVQAANGDFYGTTEGGGVNYGTVFEMSPAGALTTLHTFCSLANCADGAYPEASLLQATNGNFYGTTFLGGTSNNSSVCGTVGCGTVFEITPAGKLTTLHSFCSLANCTDGFNPAVALVQDTDGNFYGTATDGGLASCEYDYPCGTVFKITSAGTLTTLHDFCSLTNCADGKGPFGPLVQASDGSLYGTTEYGGSSGSCSVGCGTIFEITTGGDLTTLYNFCVQASCTDGELPAGGLLQATNGLFYGTTEAGGNNHDNGTVFSLSTDLSPFVAFLRNPAKVGQQFGILGYGLTGTSSVLLNGVSAAFTVKSDTLLTATVPTGAITGYVTVTTPSGTLTSNVPFHVLP